MALAQTGGLSPLGSHDPGPNNYRAGAVFTLGDVAFECA